MGGHLTREQDPEIEHLEFGRLVLELFRGKVTSWAARGAQISAAVAYAEALVDIHRATGATLKENGIELNDVLTGEITKHPTPPFQSLQKSSIGSK